jgi:hypothetical protein
MTSKPIRSCCSNVKEDLMDRGIHRLDDLTAYDRSLAVSQSAQRSVAIGHAVRSA